MSASYEQLKAECEALKASLEKECADWQKAYTAMCADYDKDIAKLKAERDKLQAVQDEQDAILRGVGPIVCIGGVEHPVARHGDCLYCARDAAYVRGLERALTIMQTEPYFPLQGIVAEIDKAKPKK